MKSVGEAMAIGRTFKEALQKGIRSMEVKRFGFGLDKYDKWLNAQKGSGVKGQESGKAGSGHGSPLSPPPTARADVMAGTPNPQVEDSSDKTTQGESLDGGVADPDGKLRRKLAVPSQGRIYYIRYALIMGWTVEQIHDLTNVDPWFLGADEGIGGVRVRTVRVRIDADPSGKGRAEKRAVDQSGSHGRPP